MKRLACVAALLLPLAAGRADAAGAVRLDKDLTCQIQVGLGEHARVGGSLPVIVHFQNAGAARTILVRTGPVPSVSRTFSVAARRTTKGCVYVPMYSDTATGSMGSVEFVDATTSRLLRREKTKWQLGQIGWVGGQDYYYYKSSSKEQLVGASISTDKALAVSEELFENHELKISRAPLNALPDHWIGYSTVDLVVIEHEAWANDSIRGPLVDWMATGGVCLIVDAPATARPDIAAAMQSKAPLVRRDGDDTIRVGLGSAVFIERAFLTGSHETFLSDSGIDGALAARRAYKQTESHPPFEAVGRPPFWSVLALLVLFAGVVGPLGWWLLIKRKGRLLLYYIAAPTVSIAAIVLTIGASFFHEGFRPYVRCIGVRLVDQRVKQRIDSAQFGVYVPFAFGTALEGEPDELPHFFSKSGGYRYDRSYETRSLVSNMSGNKRRYDGMLLTRETAWYGREHLTRERRRLVVWVKDGKIHVENHLGAELENLLVRHKDQYAHFDRLDEGGQAASDPISEAAFKHLFREHQLKWRKKLLKGSVLGRTNKLGNKRWAAVMLEHDPKGPEGAYVANAPGLVPEQLWLSDYRDEESQCVVMGVY